MKDFPHSAGHFQVKKSESDRESALRHHFLQIAVAERITAIPPGAKNNDVVEMSSPEQHWQGLDHGLTFGTITVLLLRFNRLGRAALPDYQLKRSNYLAAVLLAGIGSLAAHALGAPTWFFTAGITLCALAVPIPATLWVPGWCASVMQLDVSERRDRPGSNGQPA